MGIVIPRVVLPACVQEALTAAEHLHDVVNGAAFPDLSEDVSTIEECAHIAVAANIWARSLGEAHHGVTRLFPSRDSGVAVRLPAPVINGYRTERIGNVRVSIPKIQQSLSAHGRVMTRPPRMSIASDVLEPIPPRFEDSLAEAFPFHGMHSDNVKIEEYHMADYLGSRWRETGWPSIRTELTEAWIVMRFKCLGLVGWVREQVEALKHSTLPRIELHSLGKLGRHSVSVALAGSLRTVELTKSEYMFLAQMAHSDRSSALRVTKCSLIEKLPELSGYIESLGTGSKPNTTMYRLPTEIRSVMHVPRARQ